MKNFLTILLFASLFQLTFGQGVSDEYLKAKSYEVMESYDSSLLYFNKAIQENPNDYDAIMDRGKNYFQLGMYPEAIKDFRYVNQRYKGSASLMLARTEARLNHPELAINYLRDHLSSSYKIPEKDILLDPDINKLEGTLQWNKLWQEKAWYLPYEQQLQQARYLMSSGEYLDALNELQKLEKQGSKRSLVSQYKAEIYSITGNKKAALSEVTKAIKSDFRNLDALRLRSSLLYEAGEYEDALADCQALLRQDPTDFEYYIFSAINKSELNQYESALADIKKYLGLFPKEDRGHYEEGNIHFRHGKYLNAITSYNRALELNKGVALYYFARGKSYAATSTHKYAERDFSMALDLDPYSGETWFAKGLTDLALGDRDTACFDFRKSFQYGIYEALNYMEQLCK